MKKIVISGLFFGITAALEYIVRAARRRTDLEVVTVGPYHGVIMPWGNGQFTLPGRYNFMPDIPFPNWPIGSNVPVSMVEARLPEGFIPDIWLDVNAGFYIDGKPTHGVKTTYLTDPHVLRGFYQQSASQYAKVFCSQLSYSQPGEIYIPYAADVEWHIPLESQKLYDAMIIGNFYQNRVDLMERLKRKGLRTLFKLGVGREEMAQLYNQSLAGINWASLDDLTARVFELSAIGITPVLSRVSDLSRFFQEDKDYLGFSSAEECEVKMDWILAHPTEAAQIGKNARNTVLEGKHFWDTRLDEMLQSLT